MVRKDSSVELFTDLDELWTVHQVASYLHKPLSWVYDNHKKHFHAARAGRQLLFSPREVKEWVRGQMWPQ